MNDPINTPAPHLGRNHNSPTSRVSEESMTSIDLLATTPSSKTKTKTGFAESALRFQKEPKHLRKTKLDTTSKDSKMSSPDLLVNTPPPSKKPRSWWSEYKLKSIPRVWIEDIEIVDAYFHSKGEEYRYRSYSESISKDYRECKSSLSSVRW